jgi:hypothetical protein
LISPKVSDVNTQVWENFEILTTFSSENLNRGLYINVNLKEIEWDTWIHMAQNKDQWQALVNMVMKVLFSQKV